MNDQVETSTASRIHQYLEDHPELTQKDDPGDPVKLENKNVFGENVASSIKESVDQYLKAKTDTLLSKRRIDQSIPLDLYISSGSKVEGGQGVCRVLFIEIKREGQSKNVAEFALRDYGDEFRLSHRKVDPNYRGNGIATHAMKGIEEFVKDYSRKVPGREAVIEANAGQLDVLKWFDRNGFETTTDPVPVHPGENDIKIHNLDDVMDSLEQEDGKYKVGPHLYVFPSEYQGPYFNGEGEDPENIMIDESALVHFRKKLDTSSGEEERDQITGKIRDGVRRFLGLRKSGK
jgi:GNAT superfamily N-acetyltransferase